MMRVGHGYDVHQLVAGRDLIVGGVETPHSTSTPQAPRLAPHIPAMVANIAADLGIGADCVNVKATTTEKLGFAGREEGIAAHAGVLLVSIAERPSGYDIIP